MGKTQPGQTKTKSPLHIKPTEQFLERAKEIHANSPVRQIPFVQFCLILMDLGLDEYERQQKSAERYHAEKTTDAASDPSTCKPSA